MVSLIQIISGLFLGFAIFKIRKFLNKKGYSHLLDTKILAIHTTTFGFYMVSIVIYTIFLMIDNLNLGKETEKKFYIANIFCNICAFMSLICLCGILWQFGKKAPEDSLEN